MKQVLQTLVVALTLCHLTDGALVKNCTFSRNLWGITMPDYTFCMFMQSLYDNFQWQLGSADTSTINTGPSEDHSGTGIGHFAYVESSMRSNGTFGRLSSPTFTKPAGESGGCVQFYYHMYGSDMGTLKAQIYDTESTGDGLVKEWTMTGNQGNQWLRADIDLGLAAGQELTLQLIIEGHIDGNGLKNDYKSDMAIDDILIYDSGACSQSSETPPTTQPTTSGPSTAAPTSALSTGSTGTTLPYMWSCDFEGLNNKTCGMMLRTNGAQFRTSTRSFKSSTGPSSDHSGSGHFLGMQGLGPLPNSSAIAETPRFDQTYYCFTFWYHMYGSGMGQLRISADVNGLAQEIMSVTGDQGNQWKQAHVPLPRDGIKLIIEAIRGSTSDSDIALDDMQLSANDCQGATVPPITTTSPAPQTTTRPQPALSLACNFDSDICNFYQDPTGDFNWNKRNGGSFQADTGPSNDHTQGDFSGHYMFLPSNYKTTGTKARLQTGLIGMTFGAKVCLRFAYHMYGADMGTLNVKVKNQDGSTVGTFSESGDKGNNWMIASIDLTMSSAKVYIEIEGTVEHDGAAFRPVKGEMAIDDIMLTSSGMCQVLDIDRVMSDITVPTTTIRTTAGSTNSPTTPTSTPTWPRTSPTPMHTTTPPVIQTCTFDESSICGFTQDGNDNFDWSRLNVKTWSEDTGPSADHTQGAFAGYYMFLESSYKQPDTIARLVSPSYTKLSNSGCLTFWYHMWGQDIATLKVTLKTSSESVIWTKTGNQGNQWLQASIPIDLSSSQTFQVYFDGSIAHQYGSLAEVKGDIAIDDVSVDRRDSCGAPIVTLPGSSSTAGGSPTPPAGGDSTSRSSTAGTKATTSEPAKNPDTSSPKDSTTGAGGLLPGAQKQTTTDAPKGNNAGLIAGLVVSVLVVIVVGLLLGVIFMRRRPVYSLIV